MLLSLQIYGLNLLLSLYIVIQLTLQLFSISVNPSVLAVTHLIICIVFLLQLFQILHSFYWYFMFICIDMSD